MLFKKVFYVTINNQGEILMRKNLKSIACPKCKSIDIDLTVTYENESKKGILYYEEEAIESSREKIMNCHCKSCQNDYSVNEGKETYTLLKQPLPLTCSGDVSLISFYTTDFGHDFKLLRLSPYNGSSILIAQVENDKYPVIIPEEKGIEKDTKKVKSLIFNTWMNRYR